MTARVLFAVLLTASSCLIATIRSNALNGPQTTARRDAPAPEISTAAIPQESPLAARLSHVPDITVETIVGTLPRLPVEVAASYRENTRGPDVRVVWPGGTDVFGWRATSIRTSAPC
jgi:uncharacterized protein